MEKINGAFDPILWEDMTQWCRKRVLVEPSTTVSAFGIRRCRRPAAAGHAPAELTEPIPQQRANDLPTALLAGATKAEAAATRRAKRKKERILVVLLVLGAVCLLG